MLIKHAHCNAPDDDKNDEEARVRMYSRIMQTAERVVVFRSHSQKNHQKSNANEQQNQSEIEEKGNQKFLRSRNE